MKSTLNTYGWIITVIIVLMILIPLASPYGKDFMNKMYYFTDVLTAQKNQQMNLDNRTIELVNPTGNVVLFDGATNTAEQNILTAKPGTQISLNFSAANDLVCTAIELTYNNNSEVVSGTSFYMPDFDTTIKPIWDSPEYTKIYFGDSYESTARNIAQLTNDVAFITENRQVEIDGQKYYVVYDNSTLLGSCSSSPDMTFGNTNGIKRIIVGTKCTDIVNFAFVNCRDLEYLYIPGNVKSIGNNSFRNCDKLETLVLNEGLQKIETGAFYNCVALCGPLTIPDSVTKIGDFVFAKTQISNASHA